MANRLLRTITIGLLVVPQIASTLAQTPVRTPPPRIEPGLEAAVNWKWWTATSAEDDWGFRLPELTKKSPTAKPGDSPADTLSPIERPTSYVVKRGDALSKIARKFGMTVPQLKTANGLTKDLIRIGQTLKIPTIEELEALAPPPPPKKPDAENGGEESGEGGSEESGTEKPKKKLDDGLPAFLRIPRERRTVMMQSFLSRKNISSGPIDGYPGAMLEMAQNLYFSANPEIQTPEALLDEAIEEIGAAYTRYTLRREDFRFIALPKVVEAPKGTDPAPQPITYDDLESPAFLAYRSPWEFVAERFHCAERFLRKLNPDIKDVPKAGTTFKVPNVLPFEIEKVFDEPLQPAKDPDSNITAAIVDLKRLEIYRDEKLVAAFPMSVARPGLRGRGSWTILEATPKPRLVTKRELKGSSAPRPAAPVTPDTADVPRAQPVAPEEQDLAAGPNNPVGIVWIDLAKSGSEEPLPYGLHGTSIPGRMTTQESIGGLRLSNWDIARAVRLLAPGTPLRWR